MEIKKIVSATEFSLSYRIILCDLWGVIHNGVEVFSNAKSYLEAMKENNIDVYLISNAPRPEAVVRNGLINKLNLNPELFKKIYTSGDTGTQYINSKVHGQSYYHLGPEKDYDLLENINIQKTNDIESSEFVVCTGLYNDNDERPEDYKNIFEDFLKQNLEIVCVNPDEIVYRGQARIYCAGALGKYYEKLGGKVTYYGKPYPEIYDFVMTDLLSKDTATKKEILAIGDSLKTDCLGAHKSDLDFLFIKNGIHKTEIANDDDLVRISKANLPETCKTLMYTEILN